MLAMTQKNVSDRLSERRQWPISRLKDISYLPGLLGVRLCRELASMSMIVRRSGTGGGQAGLQIGKPQTHRWISKINTKTLPLKRTMTKWDNDTMNCYISPGWDFGDCLWSRFLWDREAVLQDRWGAGWCLQLMSKSHLILKIKEKYFCYFMQCLLVSFWSCPSSFTINIDLCQRRVHINPVSN